MRIKWHQNWKINGPYQNLMSVSISMGFCCWLDQSGAKKSNAIRAHHTHTMYKGNGFVHFFEAFFAVVFPSSKFLFGSVLITQENTTFCRYTIIAQEKKPYLQTRQKINSFIHREPPHRSDLYDYTLESTLHTISDGAVWFVRPLSV